MAWRTAGSVIGSWTEVISDDPDHDLAQALALDGSWLWNMAERTVLVRTDQLDRLAGGVTVTTTPPRPMPNQLEPVPFDVPGPRFGEPWAKVAPSLPGVDPNVEQGDLVFDAGADKWNFYDHTGNWQLLGGGAGAVSPLTLTAHNATETPLTLIADPSQTADLLDIKDSGGGKLSWVDSNGQFYQPDYTVLTVGSLSLASFGTNKIIGVGGGSTLAFQNATDISFGAPVGTSQLRVAGGAGSFGGGTGPMIYLANDTSDPTTNPVGGGIVYSSNGILKARTPDGSVSQLAPSTGMPPCSIPSYLVTGGGANIAIMATNAAIYHRSFGAGTVSKIGLLVGTSSGNICLGVYASPGGTAMPTTQLATTGSIPCPASGWALVSLGGTVRVDQNCYLAIAANNTTATFTGATSSNAWTSDAAANSAAGWLYSQASAFPLPAIAGTGLGMNRGQAIGMWGQP